MLEVILTPNEREVKKRYAPFVRYLRFQKKLDSKLYLRRKKVLEKRDSNIDIIRKIFNGDLFVFSSGMGFKIKELEFNIEKQNSGITVISKDTLKIHKNESLGKIVNDSEKKQIENEWDNKGFLAEVFSAGGTAGIPFTISDKTSSPYFFLTTLGHETFHNFHNKISAPIIYLKTDDAKKISETSAEIFGMEFTNEYIRFLPRSSYLRKLLLKDKKYNDQRIITTQNLYSEFRKLLSEGNEGKLENFLDTSSKTKPSLQREGLYCGDKEIYDNLNELYSKSANNLLYGMFSSVCSDRYRLRSTLNDLDRYDFYPINELTRMFIGESKMIQNEIDKDHFSDNFNWMTERFTNLFIMLNKIYGKRNVPNEINETLLQTSTNTQQSILTCENYPHYYHNKYPFKIIAFAENMINTIYESQRLYTLKKNRKQLITEK